MVRAKPGVDSPQDHRNAGEDLPQGVDAAEDSSVPVGHHGGHEDIVGNRAAFEKAAEVLFPEAEAVIPSRDGGEPGRLRNFRLPDRVSSEGKVPRPSLEDAVRQEDPVSPLPEVIQQEEEPQGLGPEVEKSEVVYGRVDPQNHGSSHFPEKG